MYFHVRFHVFFFFVFLFVLQALGIFGEILPQWRLFDSSVRLPCNELLLKKKKKITRLEHSLDTYVRTHVDAIDLIEIKTHLCPQLKNSIWWPPILLIQQWKCKLKCTVHRCFVLGGKCSRKWNRRCQGIRSYIELRVRVQHLADNANRIWKQTPLW